MLNHSYKSNTFPEHIKRATSCCPVSIFEDVRNREGQILLLDFKSPESDLFSSQFVGKVLSEKIFHKKRLD